MVCSVDSIIGTSSQERAAFQFLIFIRFGKNTDGQLDACKFTVITSALLSLLTNRLKVREGQL